MTVKRKQRGVNRKEVISSKRSSNKNIPVSVVISTWNLYFSFRLFSHTDLLAHLALFPEFPSKI